MPKESKCKFGMTKILYLGHVVNAQGEDTCRMYIFYDKKQNFTETYHQTLG